ncbi:hypothetical protein ACFVVX_24570 [Kitasatospora sp. NPDC058170]|uniref:hypothetical protein n=1 Tax=Kitasatospora sp. NPDC058170 TaxID=3346364 RepID=UPI0036D8B1F6
MADEQGFPPGAVNGPAAFEDGPALRPEPVGREDGGRRRPALSVLDARTGRSTGIPPGRRMLLRACVRLAAPGGRAGPGDLRAALVGDVLQRVAEIEGLQVLRVLVLPVPDPGRAAAFDRAAAALGIHPPVAVVAPGDPGTSADPGEALGGPPDAQLIAAGADRSDAVGGVWLAVGPAGTGPGDTSADGLGDGNALVEGLGAGAVEPTAVRLALLSHPYREPAGTGPRALDEAAATLRDWRRHVTDWAWAPSKPVPDDIRRQAAAAFTGDLDTPAALALLHRVRAANGLEDGARFETFAALDRVLGLELTREVGRH